MAAFIPAALTAAATIGSGILNRQRPHESKIQKKQRHFIDTLMSSLDGKGPYSDLFNFDENVFKKTFVDPALSKFRNITAPKIQQESIFNGQQRGTGLDDQLLRAGVDLDQILNQHMQSAQEGAMNRKQNAMSAILGAGPGGSPGQSVGQAAQQGAAGYLASDQFADFAKSFGQQSTPPQAQANPFATPPRSGYAPDWSTQKLNDPRWSM